MKVTFISMTVAAASLSGVPFLGGFWSKDAVLMACFNARQYYLFILVAVTIALTLFYSLRMLGMVFLGKKSRHLVELEHRGRSVHEASGTMWAPSLMLAVVTLFMGFIGPLFEEGLHKFFHHSVPYVENGFSSVSAASTNLLSIVPLVSIVMLALGGLPGYYLYIAQKWDPAKIVNKRWALRGIYRFLWNRWYLNPLYYRTFIYGTLRLSRTVFRWFEEGVMEKINYVVADLATLAYSRVRRLQTGLLYYNLVFVFIGFIALLVIALLLL